MAASESLDDRMLRLEDVVTHLQHDVEQMHGVILAQQSELQSLRRLIERIEGLLDEESQEPEVRDPQAERPPHY